MSGNLPWDLIFVGVFIAVIAEILRIPVLPFAIGVYLPISLNTTIMIGGLIRLAVDKSKKNADAKKEMENNGTLYCSGMIAGEGIMGLLLAVVAVTGVDKFIDISGIIAGLGLPAVVSDILGIAFLALMVFTIVYFTFLKKKKANKQ